MALVLLLSGSFLYDAPIHARSSVPHRLCASFLLPFQGRQAAFHTTLSLCGFCRESALRLRFVARGDGTVL